ncbi:hypothetical protein K9O30_06805 [Clostridium bowmanii]|nr:hypothetical protein [Clostridium bowmanii]MCA1073447.1 hypothetical protein [Clostridium bowmanii]
MLFKFNDVSALKLSTTFAFVSYLVVPANLITPGSTRASASETVSASPIT